MAQMAGMQQIHEFFFFFWEKERAEESAAQNFLEMKENIFQVPSTSKSVLIGSGPALHDITNR